MDVTQAAASYVTKMIALGHVPGMPSPNMKILLMDEDTVLTMSASISQTSLLNHEVYLMDRLENSNRGKMRHLRCICFVRPSASSVQFLIEELSDPRYAEYYLFFSNIVEKPTLERLAEADNYEVVKLVQESFMDFIAINSDLFSLGLSPSRNLIWDRSPESWNTNGLVRCCDGILSLLLALKKKPSIRYQNSSALAKTLALEVGRRMNREEQLFDFRQSDTAPVLLILDRRGDPVTPLLTQWTYQAMVHHLLGIQNGRVNLSGVPDIRSDLKEVVLSPDQDPFFKKNMFLNFGELGRNIKEYVEQYQSKTKNNANIESIDDMKRFIEEYPEFRKLSGNVSKHVTLVSELSRRVGLESLLETSELEQSLACNDNHARSITAIQRVVNSPVIPPDNKLCLVSLYALKYSKHPSSILPGLMESLASELPPERVEIVSKISQYHHSLRQVLPVNAISDIFDSSGLLSGARERFKGLKGVENVYTQHSPVLEALLQALIKGRLKESQFPFLKTEGMIRDRPQDIIVFTIGGATYEEAKIVSMTNAATPGVRVVFGGTTIHNASTFLEDISNITSCWPVASAP